MNEKNHRTSTWTKPSPRWWIFVAGIFAFLLWLTIPFSERAREQINGLLTEQEEPPSTAIAPALEHAKSSSRIQVGLPGADGLIVRVVDQAGQPVDGARVFLCQRIGRSSSPLDRQTLGTTSVDGQVVINRSALPDSQEASIAARARGYLPAAVSISATDGQLATLVLSPALRQSVRCTDILGDPVSNVGVLLSRMGIPLGFQAEGFDEDVQPGFDPINAIHPRLTDAEGRAEFEELLPGKYRLEISGPFHENIDTLQTSVVVAGPEVHVTLTSLVYAVVQVTGDQLYTWSVGANSKEWLSPHPSTRSLSALLGKLRKEYPGCMVYVGGCKLRDVKISTVQADLFLTRTGKRRVEVPLRSAFEPIEPLIIEVPSSDSGIEPASTVTFTIRNGAGEPVECSEFIVFKDTVILPIEIPVTTAQPTRLPFGHWSIVTHTPFLQGHFRPSSFDVSTPEASVEIELHPEIVPVRIVARGYRGESLIRGSIELSQHGMNMSRGVPDLDGVLFWLKPGETRWRIGSLGHKSIDQVVPVVRRPDGSPQIIEFNLEVADAR